MDIEKSRTLMNDYLERIFVARTEKADSIHERYRLLWDRIQRLSFCGGKRIRPYLTMVAYGQMDEKIAPVAAAQELVHIAMLIHEDVSMKMMLGGVKKISMVRIKKNTTIILIHHAQVISRVASVS